MRSSWLLLSLASCTGASASQQEQVERLKTDVVAHEARVGAVEARGVALANRWHDIELAYGRAKKNFERAEEQYARAKSSHLNAGQSFETARQRFEAAREHWVWARYLIEAAAAVDAYHLQRAQTATDQSVSYSCDDGMSTAAYRKLLEARGINLAGKDIDHIVPRLLGGADHPGNYQVISSSLNRSLGATWNGDKCSMAGAANCANAVVVSRTCGTYRGSMPGL